MMPHLIEQFNSLIKDRENSEKLKITAVIPNQVNFTQLNELLRLQEYEQYLLVTTYLTINF